MTQFDLKYLAHSMAQMSARSHVGRVRTIQANRVDVSGLVEDAALGNWVKIYRQDAKVITGEIVGIEQELVSVLLNGGATNIRVGDRVRLGPTPRIAPDDSWIGRVVDPFGRPLDGRPLATGHQEFPFENNAPEAHKRNALGARIRTGLCVFNTALPLVRGQRVGLFSGSGVGKSTLLGSLAQTIEADVIVVGLIGERGREVREFADNVLGAKGMARSVVVAATSDMSSLMRRNCATSAMAVAEYFRDQGQHVLLLLDSVTRFAEAHREIATASGEMPALRGFPASTAQKIMSLCERAGPGEKGSGDISAVFSVLVSGSDMDEPIADILRGVLDGHIVMDRSIAERGRFPPIDVLRSVSRSLPKAASEHENKLIVAMRRLLGAYQSAEPMIRAGLYVQGSDPLVDDAIKVFNDLDTFVGQVEVGKIDDSFNKLALILRGTQMFKMTQSAKG